MYIYIGVCVFVGACALITHLLQVGLIGYVQSRVPKERWEGREEAGR